MGIIKNIKTHADKRRKWRHEDNKELICWLLSNPNQRGFRLVCGVSEQLLAGQVRAIQNRD